MPKVSPQHTAARRQQILEAAWRCFARDGFHATSMQDVIGESGLSAGAVYRYYASKTALIAAAASAGLAVAERAFDDLLADGAVVSPQEALRHVLQTVVTFATERDVDLTRVAVTAWAEALRTPELHTVAAGLYAGLRARFTEVVRRWQAAGHLPPDVDAALAGQALFGLVPGFVLQRLLLGDVTPEGYAAGFAGLVAGRPD